ncbi:hypothetical protein [Nannocystis pusilla]|uniref:hypothetical protein n=1 Tax=Nannocystis pusilla TaxID=889268 RepID=UPI003B75E5F1
MRKLVEKLQAARANVTEIEQQIASEQKALDERQKLEFQDMDRRHKAERDSMAAKLACSAPAQKSSKKKAASSEVAAKKTAKKATGKKTAKKATGKKTAKKAAGKKTAKTAKKVARRSKAVKAITAGAEEAGIDTAEAPKAKRAAKGKAASRKRAEKGSKTVQNDSKKVSKKKVPPRTAPQACDPPAEPAKRRRRNVSAESETPTEGNGKSDEEKLNAGADAAVKKMMEQLGVKQPASEACRAAEGVGER